MGIDRGESGADGDFGGIRNACSVAGGGGKDAPGLKEKAGNAGDLELGFAASVAMTRTGSWESTADLGRRPVARENDEGAEYDDGRAGKTNGGFGSGSVVLGETWGLASDSSCEGVASWSRLPEGVSTIMSGPIVVAIIPKPLCGARRDRQLGFKRSTWIVGKKKKPSN